MKVLSNLVIAFFMASSVVSQDSQASGATYWRIRNLGDCGWRPTVVDFMMYSDKAMTKKFTSYELISSGYSDHGTEATTGPQLAVDDSTSTAWRPQVHAPSAGTAWIGMKFPTATAVKAAKAVGLGIGGGGGQHWTGGVELQSSPDGATWTTVAEKRNSDTVDEGDKALTAQPTLNSTCSGGVCTSGKWAAYYGGKTESQCKAICDGYRVLIPEPDGIWEKVYDWGRQDGQFHNLQKHQKEAGLNRTVDQINYGSTGGHFPGFSQRDQFYVHWKGNIAIEKAGRYTFYTRSDDGSRLSINHDQVVYNPGWHGMRTKEGSVELAAGSINPFWAEMFEGGGGAGMIVYYKGPDTGDKKVVMPSKAFLPGKINELVYYFRQNGKFHDVLKEIPAKTPKKTRKVPTISYRGTGGFWDDWYKSINERDHFYVRWEGYIDIKAAGEYKFWTKSDDGSRLYVDGASMVQNPGWHGMRDKDGKRTLTAGKHAFWAEMFEGGGGAGMEVSYSGPDTGGQRISLPQAALSSSLGGSGKLLLPENALNGLCGAFSHSPQGDCIIYTSCGSVSEAATSVCEDNSFDWVGLNGRMEGLKTCTYESKTTGGEPVPGPEPGSTGGTGEPSQLF